MLRQQPLVRAAPAAGLFQNFHRSIRIQRLQRLRNGEDGDSCSEKLDLAYGTACRSRSSRASTPNLKVKAMRRASSTTSSGSTEGIGSGGGATWTGDIFGKRYGSRDFAASTLKAGGQLLSSITSMRNCSGSAEAASKRSVSSLVRLLLEPRGRPEPGRGPPRPDGALIFD